MSRPLKVAFVVVDNRFTKSAALPFFGTAPTALLQGFEELDGEVEIHVVCCTMGEHPKPEKLGKNIWFHAQSVPKWGFLRSLHFGCHRAVRKMIREIQPDIIHAQGTERWCAITSAMLPYPKVLTIHGFLRMIDPLMKMQPRWYWKTQTILERFAIPRFDGIVAITTYTQSNVTDIAQNTWVIPNATDKRYFSIERTPVKPPVILYVGVIQDRKNQVGFLDALAPLAEEMPFRVRICGYINPDDTYARELLERIAKYPWAESAGKISRDELTTELEKCSVLALVSHEDNCPMTILEAMSAGIPVLASKVGGIPDLVTDGLNGQLCDPADPVSIREGLRRILSDPAHAEALGKAGKQRALERYLPIAVAKRHLEVYREVLATKRSKPQS
jgi:glycosyltransferase involved in cell wall biosynthesis